MLSKKLSKNKKFKKLLNKTYFCVKFNKQNI